jgi:uncharacterized protein
MNLFGITPRSYHLIITTFLNCAEVEQVVLFGSRAKWNYQQGSDIDVAIKGKACTLKTALTISAILNEQLPIPYQVDVVDYNSLASTSLKEHIDRVGVVFFDRAITSSSIAI